MIRSLAFKSCQKVLWTVGAGTVLLTVLVWIALKAWGYNNPFAALLVAVLALWAFSWLQQ